MRQGLFLVHLVFAPPLSSVLCQVHCSLNVSPIDSMSSFALSIHRSLGLPLFLFLSTLACSALFGIRIIGILSTCPNHRSLRWMTLSRRVVWLHNACLMSSFLILCSLFTRAILQGQLISAAMILFSSIVRIVQHSEPYRKIGCIIV